MPVPTHNMRAFEQSGAWPAPGVGALSTELMERNGGGRMTASSRKYVARTWRRITSRTSTNIYEICTLGAFTRWEGPDRILDFTPWLLERSRPATTRTPETTGTCHTTQFYMPSPQ